MFILSVTIGVFIGIIIADYLKQKNTYLFIDKFISKVFLSVKTFLLKQKKKIIFYILTTLLFITFYFVNNYYKEKEREQYWKEWRENQDRLKQEKLMAFCKKIKNIDTKDVHYEIFKHGYYEHPRFWNAKEYREDRRYYIKVLEEKLSNIRSTATRPYYDEYYDCFDQGDGSRISWKKGVEIVCK